MLFFYQIVIQTKADNERFAVRFYILYEIEFFALYSLTTSAVVSITGLSSA